MFKKNDALVNSVKSIMELSNLDRQIEEAVNEEFGVTSKNALPHELKSLYEQRLAEAKKCMYNEKVNMTQSDIAALEHPKKTFDEKDLAALRANKHKTKKKEELEEKKDYKLVNPALEKKAKEKKAGMEEEATVAVGHKPTTTPAKGAKPVGKLSKSGAEVVFEAGKSYGMPIDDMMLEPLPGSSGRPKPNWAQSSKDPAGQTNPTSKFPGGGISNNLGRDSAKPSKHSHGNAVDIKERHMTEPEKEKETKLKAKYDSSGMKEAMKKRYGEKKGKNVYFAKIRKEAMKEDIDSITEEIKNSLQEQLLAVYESGDEAAFEAFVNSLTEEQIQILELMGPTQGVMGGSGAGVSPTGPSGGGISGNAGRSTATKVSPTAPPGGGIAGTRSAQGAVSTAQSGGGMGVSPTGPSGGGISGNAGRNAPSATSSMPKPPMKLGASGVRPPMSRPRPSMGPIDTSSLSGGVKTQRGYMEEQAPSQLKESFEQFLRKRFLKG